MSKQMMKKSTIDHLQNLVEVNETAIEQWLKERVRDGKTVAEIGDCLAQVVLNLHPNLQDKIEKFLVRKALTETKGNQVQAAKLLGISRNTLRNRIEKYNLSS